MTRLQIGVFSSRSRFFVAGTECALRSASCVAFDLRPSHNDVPATDETAALVLAVRQGTNRSRNPHPHQRLGLFDQPGNPVVTDRVVRIPNGTPVPELHCETFNVGGKPWSFKFRHLNISLSGNSMPIYRPFALGPCQMAGGRSCSRQQRVDG
jgi:hypothetical protein